MHSSSERLLLPPASLLAFLSFYLAATPLQHLLAPDSYPNQKPAVAKLIFGLPAAARFPKDPVVEDEGLEQLQFATVSWFHLPEVPPC